jgi:hypothetical protein
VLRVAYSANHPTLLSGGVVSKCVVQCIHASQTSSSTHKSITDTIMFAYALRVIYVHTMHTNTAYDQSPTDSAPVDCAAVWEHVPAGLEQSLEPVLLTKALYPAELAVGNYYAFAEVCMYNNFLHCCLLLWMLCVLKLLYYS